ncbi:unnamed protein product [Sphenostylis stenocarpa]|uniref:Uncharacterized protein n=1 Tax=Sphenostylis stenocarpa TaxID=92480 RepID=A0AA86S172_9FABA|nr:unnamed protein product [Sphenostylis stenocarpa]
MISYLSLQSLQFHNCNSSLITTAATFLCIFLPNCSYSEKWVFLGFGGYAESGLNNLVWRQRRYFMDCMTRSNRSNYSLEIHPIPKHWKEKRISYILFLS